MSMMSNFAWWRSSEVALPRIVLCLLLLKVASGFIARSTEETRTRRFPAAG